MSKIIFSGVQPSGNLHLGNYLGAIKNWVNLQDEYKCIFCVVDYHAITVKQDPIELKKKIIEIAKIYLAAGINPEDSIIFQQSRVSAHPELAWILNTITKVPELERMTQFKDKSKQNKTNINMGLFDYPVLMAADILIQDSDVVPVGKDQKQHVEYARDIAEKFNRVFGETFKLPKHQILEETETVQGTDGQKMSKSYGNTIGLFFSDEEIQKAVMSIPTNSKGVEESKDPEDCNIFALHKLFSSEDELNEIRKRYIEGGLGYKESKDILIKNIKDFISPLREKRKEFADNKELVLEILRKGGEVAHQRAEEKMKDVRQKVGIEL